MSAKTKDEFPEGLRRVVPKTDLPERGPWYQVLLGPGMSVPPGGIVAASELRDVGLMKRSKLIGDAIPLAAIIAAGATCVRCSVVFADVAVAVGHVKHFHSEREEQKRADDIAKEAVRVKALEQYRAKVIASGPTNCPCCGSARPPGHRYAIYPADWERATGLKKWGANVGPVTIAAARHDLAGNAIDDRPPAA